MELSRHSGAIIARLVSEDAADLSDAELSRCLAPCVGGSKLVILAQNLRDTDPAFKAAFMVASGRAISSHRTHDHSGRCLAHSRNQCTVCGFFYGLTASR